MVSKTPSNFSIVVKSRPSAVVEVCEQVLSQLEVNGFGKDDIFAVHLALEEAFLNAVKHGNKMDSSKEVKIDCNVDFDKIEISLTDEGEGFEPSSVADPRFGEDLYKPGGRGLLLMNSYMDVVKFNETGNSLYMVRYKEKPRLSQDKDRKKI
ncbi:MAG: ATP-binding protein [Sedimentisphaerales bacterium]|nr:ATP-binding protein [Sedimentisphaerales bacterium]